MTQIGFSLKIAFPSRRDRDRCEGIAADLFGMLDEPTQVIHFFRRQIDRYPWSDGFKAAFFEFEKRFQAGDRLLLDHAFWYFIKETAQQVASDGSNDASCLRMVPDLDREPQAEAISVSKVESDGRWEHVDRVGYVLSGGLEYVLQTLIANSRRLDGILYKASREATKGVLAFKEDGWGSWSWSQHPDSAYVRLLVHDRIHERCPQYFGLRKASAHWWMSEQMGQGQFESICTALGIASPPSGALKRVAAEGGIKTAGMYLGRRSLLPIIRAHAGVEVAIEPQRAELGTLELGQLQDDRIQLSSTARLSGRWRISVTESDRAAPSELSLTFIDRAVLHPSLTAPNPDAWRRDAEASGFREIEIRQGSHIGRPVGQVSDSMYDLLEAVYAGGRSGWSEMDLIPLLARISGTHGPRPWDLLRALRDSRWLDPWVARGWKARRWFLSPIKLVQAGETIILSGAAGEVSRERFARIAEELGGQVEIDGTVGCWAVPLIKATHVDAAQLSKAIGLELQRPIVLDIQKAPLCWSNQHENFDRRELVSRWDWKNERFSYTSDPGASPVMLETWIRPARDSPDLYRVVRRDGSEALFANRTAAILETYRLARRPLFEKRGSWLFAKTSDGRLPDVAVDRLRLRHLIAPGIVSNSSEFGYAYPVDENDMVWLGERLGSELFEQESISKFHPAFHFRTARGEKFFRATIMRRG
ncbi:hypothetical protein GPL17_19055 [Bradyrhizobium yuanmingense]|uniref:hypothetical protein n=1 Tax=Bradyrhizobium yuanmingense TaxID=108015 RepID=UPI0012FA9C5A|nr:hypothetical protein [Bradyrhizobium yuanmingense]MVT52583.1 hypothetical protein [Bradyrhizobium yuanmingense]